VLPYPRWTFDGPETTMWWSNDFGRACGRPATIGLVAGGLALGGPARAEDDIHLWLTPDEVRAQIVGRVTEGTYNDGRAWNEDARADGTTTLIEEGARSVGIWFFDESDHLCFRYSGGEATGGCFRYRRISENCYDHMFQANPVDEPGIPAGTWISNGLLWRKHEPRTCEAQPSS
jgi:hypothetical protein